MPTNNLSQSFFGYPPNKSILNLPKVKGHYSVRNFPPSFDRLGHLDWQQGWSKYKRHWFEARSEFRIQIFWYTHSVSTMIWWFVCDVVNLGFVFEIVVEQSGGRASGFLTFRDWRKFCHGFPQWTPRHSSPDYHGLVPSFGMPLPLEFDRGNGTWEFHRNPEALLILLGPSFMINLNR